MKKVYKSCTGLLLIGSIFLLSCTTVPVTGRQQLNFIPASSLLSMSLQEYDQFLKSNKISTDQHQNQMVKKSAPAFRERWSDILGKTIWLMN
ncbi:MAG: hypothetical protein Q7J12_00535 [Syntrophales bacterium]|nr:hypothetical protein [Syntrophales bacterium]